MSDWKPIESAPRDGSILLLYCPYGVERLYASPAAANQFCLGFYGDGNAYANGWYSVESREEIWGMGSEYTGPMTSTECLDCVPTHWMPLPPPPTGEKI